MSRRAFNKVAGWALALLGALFVFSGLVELAVGPEMDVAKEGLDPAQAASRWWGLLTLAIGFGLLWGATKVDRTPPAPPTQQG